MSPSILSVTRLLPWIELRFSRSPGPGGQNVNKVNTRVTLFFDFTACTELSDTDRARIRRTLSTRMSRDGRLRIVRYRDRTQARNRAAAETGLIELLAEALRRQPQRRPTRPTAASLQRRLDLKRRHGELKRRRQQRPTMDA
jgi:ribosome-associated protein